MIELVVAIILIGLVGFTWLVLWSAMSTGKLEDQERAQIVRDMRERRARGE